MTPLQFFADTCKLAFQGIGTYTMTLIALDEVWWSPRRHWRYLLTGCLTLVVTLLLQWGAS